MAQTAKQRAATARARRAEKKAAADAAKRAKDPAAPAAAHTPAAATSTTAARDRPGAESPRPADTPAALERYKKSLGKTIRVRATKMGFIDLVRRREGDVFDVREKEFSDRWMEVVDGDTPAKVTTGRQALKAHHDEVIGQRMAAKSGGTASAPAPKSSGDRDVS